MQSSLDNERIVILGYSRLQLLRLLLEGCFIGDYVAVQRSAGKVRGAELRAAIGPLWTEEKNVWKIPLSCSVQEIEEGLEQFRKEVMQKYGRDPSTTWTEFINGEKYTVGSVLGEL